MKWLDVLAQFDELLAEVGRLRGARLHGHLTITGGEPLIHPDLFSLLHRIAGATRHSFALLTNGMLIDHAVARELSCLGIGFVQVSIDGDRATHDRIRGIGAYDAAVAGVKCLVAAGVTTLISFTAHRMNFRQFPSVAQLGRALGVRRVWADRLVPLGHGGSLGGMAFGPAHLAEFLQIMRREQQSGRSRTEIAMHRSLQFLVGDGPAYRCTAGRSLLTLLPDGQVVPCRRMPIPIGNILQTSLTKLYRDDAQLAELRAPRVAAGCERCFYASECGGGARCQAWAQTGDPCRADPDCWLARRMSLAQIQAGTGCCPVC